MPAGYETTLPSSTKFCLTVPQLPTERKVRVPADCDIYVRVELVTVRHQVKWNIRVHFGRDFMQEIALKDRLKFENEITM